MDCHGAVEQLLLNKERRADDQQRSEGTTRLNDLAERSNTGVEQRVLVKQVFIRIAREPQLGKYNDGGVTLIGALSQADAACGVLDGVAKPDGGNTDGYSHESVSIDRIEWRTLHTRLILSTALSSDQHPSRRRPGEPAGVHKPDHTATAYS
jgi:hypothetical protein